MQICVIAKEPRPGFAKTRLAPPCTPDQAARIAEAALADTLDAVVATPARRHVVALEGRTGPWLPSGFAVIEQVGGGLGERLDAAFAACFSTAPDVPVVLIGMDTPHVTPTHLLAAGARLHAGADAVMGMATDGGYWLLGMRRRVTGAFTGVPMSTASTGRAQRARLERLGCSVEEVDLLDDVDHFSDAKRVARRHPVGRFASVVAQTVESVGAAVS